MIAETMDEDVNYIYAIKHDGHLLFSTRYHDRYSPDIRIGFTPKTKRLYLNPAHAKSALTILTEGLSEKEKVKFKIAKLKFEEVL
jgi:hypothetical protein